MKYGSDEVYVLRNNIASEMFVKITLNRTIKTVYTAKNKNISNIFPISISIFNITLLTNLKSPWIYYIL